MSEKSKSLKGFLSSLQAEESPGARQFRVCKASQGTPDSSTLEIECRWFVTIRINGDKKTVSPLHDFGWGKRGHNFPKEAWNGLAGFDTKEEAKAALEKLEVYFDDLQNQDQKIIKQNLKENEENGK